MNHSAAAAASRLNANTDCSRGHGQAFALSVVFGPKPLRLSYQGVILLPPSPETFSPHNPCTMGLCMGSFFWLCPGYLLSSDPALDKLRVDEGWDRLGDCTRTHQCPSLVIEVGIHGLL